MFSPLLRVDDHADYVLSDSLSSPMSDYAVSRAPVDILSTLRRRDTKLTNRRHFQVFSCDPEPPEARVRTPRAKDTKVKDPFILKPTRAGGLGANFGELLLPCCDNAMLTLFSQIFSQTRTARGARGVPSRDKRWWRPLHPARADLDGRLGVRLAAIPESPAPSCTHNC